MSSPTQDFTARNLGWMRRHRRQFGLKPDEGVVPKKPSQWTEYLTGIEGRVAGENFKFGKLTLARISKNGKTKQVVATESLDEVLVLRRMNENIRRSYGIKNPNRNTLLRTLRQTLAENTEKNIFRLDIKSCFESISRHAVYSRLIADGLVSFQTLSLLQTLFDALDKMPQKTSRKGLPRGLAISSTLAEIVLTQLETDIRKIPGVYVVLRYVDDLVVITTDLKSTLEESVRIAAGRHRLRLNVKKSKITKVSCECDPGCTHGDYCPCLKQCGCEPKGVAFEYLGYALYMSNRNSKAEPNHIVVRLSKGKVSKIKTRITMAARSYIKDGNFDLLSRRLELLTGNLQMMDSDGSRGLSVGLAYTHSNYDLNAENEMEPTGDLTALNGYLRRTVAFCLHLRPAPGGSKLYRFCFISGFRSRRRIKLKAKEISRVSECWRHA